MDTCPVCLEPLVRNPFCSVHKHGELVRLRCCFQELHSECAMNAANANPVCVLCRADVGLDSQGVVVTVVSDTQDDEVLITKAVTPPFSTVGVEDDSCNSSKRLGEFEVDEEELQWRRDGEVLSWSPRARAENPTERRALTPSLLAPGISSSSSYSPTRTDKDTTEELRSSYSGKKKRKRV